MVETAQGVPDQNRARLYIVRSTLADRLNAATSQTRLGWRAIDKRLAVVIEHETPQGLHETGIKLAGGENPYAQTTGLALLANPKVSSYVLTQGSREEFVGLINMYRSHIPVAGETLHAGTIPYRNFLRAVEGLVVLAQSAHEEFQEAVNRVVSQALQDRLCDSQRRLIKRACEVKRMKGSRTEKHIDSGQTPWESRLA